MKNKKKKLFWVAVICILFGCVAMLVIGEYYLDNKKSNFDKKYVLYVTPETTVEQVLDSLCVAAGAGREHSLERAFKKMNVSEKMKPGKYVVRPGHPSIYVARMLVYNWQEPHMLTLSGTIRKRDVLARKIGSQMMVSTEEVAAALKDSVFLAKYGFTTEDVFGLILPDSYEMYWTASIDDIFDRFKKEYDAFWTEERKAKAKAQGLTQKEVSVVASIVSGETLKEFEYPIIAGVYLNRYRTGMKLQADPTICYCYDYTLDRVLNKHLQVESPYNTYKYAGLPPAPINVPSKACLDAVLNPDGHGYIYFCASPAFDGTHRFAVTYSEHLDNAREFQQALNERRKKK